MVELDNWDGMGVVFLKIAGKSVSSVIRHPEALTSRTVGHMNDQAGMMSRENDKSHDVTRPFSPPVPPERGDIPRRNGFSTGAGPKRSHATVVRSAGAR